MGLSISSVGIGAGEWARANGIESGETMKVAGLKAIDTVVESSAVLIQSRHPTNQDLVKVIKSRIKGYIGTLRSLQE
jgi:ATP phosphoribosyltransferase